VDAEAAGVAAAPALGGAGAGPDELAAVGFVLTAAGTELVVTSGVGITAGLGC